jgi:hypothetical protein
MKQIAIITLLIGFSCLVSGQKTATEYFAKLPDVPGNCCAMDDSARIWYTDNLREVSNEISEDVHARTKAIEEFMNAHRGDAEATAMKNAGFEGIDVEQLKKMDTKHMTKEQKAAMADQMMQKYMNMSMEEVKKVKTYDTAGQRRWAQAYATERMADQSADPEKLQADQLRNKTMFDLLQKQKDLNDKMNARWDKYRQMFDTLKKEADIARTDLDRQQKPLYEQLEKGDLADGQREAIEDQIYSQNLSFCQQYNPEHNKILSQYRTTLFEILMKADYDTLENVQHEILKYQMGVEDPMFKPGLYAIQAVQGYATLLGNVFIYSVGTLSHLRVYGAE